MLETLKCFVLDKEDLSIRFFPFKLERNTRVLFFSRENLPKDFIREKMISLDLFSHYLLFHSYN